MQQTSLQESGGEKYEIHDSSFTVLQSLFCQGQSPLKKTQVIVVHIWKNADVICSFSAGKPTLGGHFI